MGNSVFQFLFSALLDLDFIRHRDSAALFNTRFFGAEPLAPDFIRHRDPAALFNSRFFGAAPLEPHFIHCRAMDLDLVCFSIIARTQWRVSVGTPSNSHAGMGTFHSPVKNSNFSPILQIFGITLDRPFWFIWWTQNGYCSSVCQKWANLTRISLKFEVFQQNGVKKWSAELSWAGPDQKNPELSWAHQLS